MTHTIHLHPRTAVRILHAAVFLLLCCFLSESRAQTGPLPVCDWFRFSRDLQTGQPDMHGDTIGGTEVMWIVSHKGKLHSATSYWNNTDYHGPQMIRKDAHNAPWVVEHTFPPNVVRNDALNSFVFTRDRYGNTLNPPDTLLIASFMTLPIGNDRNIRIWTRDDDAGAWIPSANIDTNRNVQDSYIRSFTFHTDAVTGMEYIFAGGSNGKLYKGSYDASLPNRIYWDALPEIVMGSGERFHSGAVCNGRLYVSGGRNIQTPEEGGVYLRIDGVNPSWKRVYVFPEGNNQSMRALTAVPDPLNPSSQVLVGTREIAGVIERIVPMPDDTVQVMLEMDVRQSFTTTWGGLGGQVAIAAYNRLDEGADPTTGEAVWFLGMNIKHPNPSGTPEANNAYTLVRDVTGKYSLCMVVDSSILVPPGVGLKSVRTVQRSPFPEDSGRVYYFGGFDGANGPHRNTAWIYKGIVPRPVPTVADRHAIPLQGALRQNIPNPFHDNTVISYDIPTASHVLLRVYDAMGKCVATLVDGYVTPGTHQVRLTARDFPQAAGLLFYQLIHGNEIETRKMMVRR